MRLKQWVARATASRGLGTLALALAVAVAGVVISQPAQAQIAGTKHNLGTSPGGATGANKCSGTAEICVFCHTPHGADTSAAVPLWNRTDRMLAWSVWPANGVGAVPDVSVTIIAHSLE